MKRNWVAEIIFSKKKYFDPFADEHSLLQWKETFWIQPRFLGGCVVQSLLFFYAVFVFCPLYYLSIFDLRLLITYLVFLDFFSAKLFFFDNTTTITNEG